MSDLDSLLEQADTHRKRRAENPTPAPLVNYLRTGRTDDRLTPKATARTRAAIEDAAFMAHHGETLTGAAHRLGLTISGLERMLTRYGLHKTNSRLRQNTKDRS